MIIEIGEGLMTILVILSIMLLLGAPEIMILIIVVGVISFVGLGASGKEITIKSKDSVIIQMNKPDSNTSKIDVGKV